MTTFHSYQSGRSILPLLVFLVATVAIVGMAMNMKTGTRSDPLATWSDDGARAAIVDFVSDVTNDDSPNYVPPNERIAVFDNDGTLWAEQPLYFQLLFAVDRIKVMAPDHPEWENTEPFQSILNGDLASALSGGTEAIMQIIAASHSGMTTDEFAQQVDNWVATAKHPTTGRAYTEMVYQPMLELLDYLRENQFKTYIVSGGGIDLMRTFSEDVYGIPPEQVVGSSLVVEYEYRDGDPVLLRKPEINFIDDKAGKPVGIHQHIGRRPIAAFGNSDGDLQMLQWTCAQQQRRTLCAFVHHTDADREWAYDRASHIGQLNAGLDQAETDGWLLIDMKSDWQVIFPPVEDETTDD